jgi:hypothetical protein
VTFLKALLQIEPSRRPTAAHALDDPFFLAVESQPVGPDLRPHAGGQTPSPAAPPGGAPPRPAIQSAPSKLQILLGPQGETVWEAERGPFAVVWGNMDDKILSWLQNDPAFLGPITWKDGKGWPDRKREGTWKLGVAGKLAPDSAKSVNGLVATELLPLRVAVPSYADPSSRKRSHQAEELRTKQLSALLPMLPKLLECSQSIGEPKCLAFGQVHHGRAIGEGFSFAPHPGFLGGPVPSVVLINPC